MNLLRTDNNLPKETLYEKDFHHFSGKYRKSYLSLCNIVRWSINNLFSSIKSWNNFVWCRHFPSLLHRRNRFSSIFTGVDFGDRLVIMQAFTTDFCTFFQGLGREWCVFHTIFNRLKFCEILSWFLMWKFCFFFKFETKDVCLF